MKFNFSVVIILFSLSLIAQEKFSKQISLVTDNDLYVSVNRDRYYTSGVFITYRQLTKNKNKKLNKRIFEWQIGHEMYTPNTPIVQFISEHDRPFAAYLYGGLNIKRVYKTNKILNTSVQIGVLGPNAKGDALQNGLHSLYGFREVIGWKHQIKNAFALNFGAEYIHFLGKDTSNTIDVSWLSSANFGTMFTNISTGLKLRFSFNPLQEIMNSIAFNTNLNDNTTKYKRETESFFYIKPTLRYALYDATLQGSFLNTSSEVTKELIPFVFDVTLGYKFTVKRFNFGYAFNYNTSKSEGLRFTYGNRYGSIIVQYLLD